MAIASPLASSALTVRSPERDQLLEQYRDHLIQERGLAAPTVAGYQTVARQFLAHLATSDGCALSKLDAGVVIQSPGPRSISRGLEGETRGTGS
jgi:hypothetical protein